MEESKEQKASGKFMTKISPTKIPLVKNEHQSV